jgi:serine O-acetyltransferase
MNINKWLNGPLLKTIDKLEKSITEDYHVESADSLGLSGCRNIYDILDDILSVLFPGCYSKEPVLKNEINFYLGDILRHISYKFLKYLTEVLKHRCQDDKCENCKCEDRAEKILISLVESLPEIRSILIQDIKAAKAGDPAAKSLDEVVLSYPFVNAIATHRIAHALYKLNVPIIPRIMSEKAHSTTGIDIHPGAEIGPEFFIDHGTGVVIGETCTIGKNVQLYQGVTLGALSPFDRDGTLKRGKKRHPDIEDDVIIYANSTILGGNTVIGKGSVIGGNTWITKSVPPGSIIYKQQ